MGIKEEGWDYFYLNDYMKDEKGMQWNQRTS